jgi:hypothetical protein
MENNEKKPSLAVWDELRPWLSKQGYTLYSYDIRQDAFVPSLVDVEPEQTSSHAFLMGDSEDPQRKNPIFYGERNVSI